MDRKQKEQLRILLKARKRADKVLAGRREVARKKLEHDQRKQANQALMEQYTRELTALAQQSGILSLAEQAAHLRGGNLAQEVSYYIDYGLSSNHLHQALMDENQGNLCASHLALRITWGEAGALKEVEIRVHKNGLITFHYSPLPIFPIIWRHYPQVLEKMLASALNHPRPPLPQHPRRRVSG